MGKQIYISVCECCGHAHYLESKKPIEECFRCHKEYLKKPIPIQDWIKHNKKTKGARLLILDKEEHKKLHNGEDYKIKGVL